jgi:hypothetical protein
MTVFGFFEWCDATAIGIAIRESMWAFAVIESVHLLGLALIGGAVILVNLRMLGLGLRRQTLPQVARETQPYLNASVAVMLVTGIGLFLSEPMKLYYSTPFWVKMTSLSLSLIFTYTIWRKIAMAEQTSPVWAKLAAVVSLILWFGVGAGGRWIGFSG